MEQEEHQLPLERVVFSVVDVETTGLHAGRDRITEVAIVQIRNREIIHTYSSLLNPQCAIPLVVQRLTSITDEMVSTAPLFSDIASQLDDLLRGSVMVAHNARFDAAFLQAEFVRSGYAYVQRTPLDTVTLARRVIPGVSDYKLRTLCSHLGIVPGKHRALSDAVATAQVFTHLLGIAGSDILRRVTLAHSANS